MYACTGDTVLNSIFSSLVWSVLSPEDDRKHSPSSSCSVYSNNHSNLEPRSGGADVSASLL